MTGYMTINGKDAWTDYGAYLCEVSATEHVNMDELRKMPKMKPYTAVSFRERNGEQLPDVLPILKQNRSEYFVFVGNDPHAVEVMQAMQRPADKIAFGFQSSGGHRDVDKVVSAHVGVEMTIGGATAPLSGVFRYRVKTAFEGAKYKLTFVSDMDGWLKCHLALILPACYLCYACSGDLSKATKEQRDLVLDAAWEACEMLKAAHIPVDDKENTDCYRAGTPGRRKMDAMILALCKTPLGRLCVSDHAMHAVAEMQYLDEAFEGLRTRTSVRKAKR